MKQLLFLCGIVLALMIGSNQAAKAQNNGNPIYPAWVTTGQIPQNVAVHLVQEVRPMLQQAFGLSLGQLIQRYNNGQLTIVIETTSPPTVVVFRVSYGGISIEIIDDSF